MADRGVARKSDSTTEGLITSGTTTVIIEDKLVAVEGLSVDSKGASVLSHSSTVFAEDKGVARLSDSMSNGRLISSASQTVFAG